MVNKSSFESDIQKAIVDAFSIFDQDSNKTVDIREIGTIVRSLGCCPNEVDLKDILAEVEEEDSPGFIHLDKFLPVMTKIMLEHRFKPASTEILIRAFQILDTSNRGWLFQEELLRLLTQEGEPFTKEEVEEMLTVAADSDNNRIYYTNFVKIMTADLNT